MPKYGFKKYHEERVEMENYCNKYAFISNFDDNKKVEFKNKINTHFSFTRTAIDTMIIGSLLSKYTFEQIFNPNEEEKDAINIDLENEKTKLYSMVHEKEHLTEDEEREFNSHAASQLINVVLASKEYLNNIIKDDYSFEKLPLAEKKKLYTIFSIQHDAFQEMGHIKSIVGEKYKQLVDEDGKNDLMRYYEDISNISYNISGAFTSQSIMQPSIIGLLSNEENDSPRKKAEEDVDILLNSIIPCMVADSIVNDHINNQNEKDISKMDPSTAYEAGFSFGVEAVKKISKKQKNHLVDLMANPVTREVLLSQVIDSDKSKIFSINYNNKEVSLEPLINSTNVIYDIAFGQSELEKNTLQENEINEYSNIKHHQFIKLGVEEKEDFKKGLSTKYSSSRTAFDTLFWGRMLLKGYSIDELINYDENSSERIKEDYEAIRKEFFEEKMPKEEDINNIERQKIFDTYAAEAYIKVMQETCKLHIEKMKEKKSYADFSLAEKQKSDLLIGLTVDAFQESGRIEKNAIIGEADFERIVKEQNPGNENAWNEFKILNNPGISQISSSVKFYKDISQHLAELDNMTKNKTAEEILKTTACTELKGTICKMIALKMTEKSCGDLIKNTTIDKVPYTQTFWGYSAQTEDIEFHSKMPWVDEKVFAEILSDRLKMDAFLNALNEDPEDLCTIRDGKIVDFNPINEKAKKINDTPFETLVQEKTIRNKIVKIADIVLASSKKEDDIKNLSDDRKIEMVMNMHCIGNGAGHIYGEEYNEKNPNASRDKKINNYIRELANDAMNGSNEEIYAFLPNKEGHSECYRINNYSEFTFEEKPRTLFSSIEKSYKIKALEEFKLILDKNGVSSGDSDEYKRLKKCLDDSIEPLKRTLDPEKINEMLGEIADKADAYYIAKLDLSQNNRRSVRFNAASVLRNINKDNFNKKVNMKQNLLERVAYIYAKDKVKNGTQEEKNRYKSVTDPYNREKLEILAETIGLNPNIKNKLDNCKDDKQIKALFDKIKKKKDIPEAKNVVERLKDNSNGPAI